MLDAASTYARTAESNPSAFINGGQQALVDQAREKLASYVHAPRGSQDIVLIENASGGINSILRSLGLRQGDVLLILSSAYGPFLAFYEYLVRTLGIKVVTVPLQWPLSGPEDVLDPWIAALDSISADPAFSDAKKVAVMSHISSYPAVVMPVVNAVAAARERGFISIIDGAHCLGNLVINISQIDPDFYFANGHKWSANYLSEYTRRVLVTD